MISEKASLLVTGGAGFIGSAFIRMLLQMPTFSGRIVNVDKLTYAANLDLLKGFHNHPRYRFIQADIQQQRLIETICLDAEIDAIVHFAAETHVDRSIEAAQVFVDTNIQGTLALLEVVRQQPEIHFHHVSTDEVYGSLGDSGHFTERSAYRPNSPYAATKAASDHLVRSYAHTYNLSTTISHCGNNYGPGQYPEKLIPLVLSRCLAYKTLPVYGHGANVRDWIYVKDHVEAIWTILTKGKRSQTYNISGQQELSNLELIHSLIDELAKYLSVDSKRYRSLIRFVVDRPGHDFRYAMDSSKIVKELGWQPRWTWKRGLKKTIAWYVDRFQKTPFDR